MHNMLLLISWHAYSHHQPFHVNIPWAHVDGVSIDTGIFTPQLIIENNHNSFITHANIRLIDWPWDDFNPCVKVTPIDIILRKGCQMGRNIRCIMKTKICIHSLLNFNFQGENIREI